MTDPEAEFVARYRTVYEHSPWVAEHAAARAAGLTDPGRIADVMAKCVDDASHERQLALIRAHPDLADRTRISADLTDDSRAEQASAGLDRCSADEFERFRELNAAYRKKFGFPFVIAVRGKSRNEILERFSARLDSDYNREFRTALAEIHKIARQRLLSIADDDGR